MEEFYLKIADLMNPLFPQPGEGYSWPLFAILFIFFFVVALLVREFACWLFKINQVNSHLKKIERLLEAKREKEEEGIKVVK